MSRRMAAIRVLSLLAAAAALVACGSVFSSKLPAPSLYLLSAHAGTPGPAIAADLNIFKPQVRAGLDTDRIAVLYPDRRLDYYAAARWSAPLDTLIQDLAVQSFRAQANLRSVSGDASPFSAGYWLEIEVTDFQAEYLPGEANPTIHVHFSALFGKAADRGIIDRFEANATRRASDNRLTAIVAAYEDAADAALAEVVADTAGALSASP
ncbi:MAG TPA: ABC-type transport auxiliary lipoprotein family protein [Steroidobacteraceae bacterium]|nr:ABC-type transport auxiliary lipoprotein family protein [Steroidobacteraceae bacterium]